MGPSGQIHKRRRKNPLLFAEKPDAMSTADGAGLVFLSGFDDLNHGDHLYLSKLMPAWFTTDTVVWKYPVESDSLAADYFLYQITEQEGD